MATNKDEKAKVSAAFAPDYLEVLSKCEKVAKVQSLTLSTEDRLSTGLLCLDGILGGGITAGMYTFFGPEQSAKTTAAITIAGASIHQDVGIRILWDAENSSGSSTDYISNIFNTLKVKADVETVFGVKKDGKYSVKPQIYYRDEGEAEKYFDYLAALLRRLPNKRYEDKRWWFVYPRDKEHLAQFGNVMDKKMSSMNDAIYIPAKNGALQGLIVVDSYPSLVPSEADEDDASGGLALQARTFSQGLQRIKGKLRAKRFAIVGVNQLRTAPMVRFGCLHADTSIPFVDGSSHRIADIVEKKIKGKVWSFNEETKRIEPKKIIGWHNNGEVDNARDWISIHFDAIDTANGNGCVTVTPDHEVLTDTGWTTAKKLRIGDKVVSRYRSIINGSLKDFMVGSLSGDSAGIGSYKRAVYRLQDSSNPEYLEWKRQVLSDVLPMQERFADSQSMKRARQLSSKSSYELAKIKRLMPNRLPLNSKHWTPLSFAIWFMDDGSSDRQQSRAPRGSLSIKRFKNNPQALEKVRNLFNDHGYENLKQNNTNIIFSRRGYLKLCADICTYVPECMQYKLPEAFRGKYRPLRLTSSEQQKPEYIEVIKIERGSPRKFRNPTKYDITVQDNHNYIAGSVSNGIVVHNSPDYEPGGQSLKFYSDVRLRMYPHALSAAPFNPKEGEDKGFESEESIFGGKDKYRYIKATAHKNKLSVPGRFTWLRLWVEDHEGQGRGYDPVFDTLWALHVTKQVEPMSSKKNIRLHPHGRDAMKKTISMTQFKQLIIGTNEMKSEVWSYLGINKVIDLRAYLRKQMLTGQYEDLYIAARNSKPVKEEESE